MNIEQLKNATFNERVAVLTDGVSDVFSDYLLTRISAGATKQDLRNKVTRSLSARLAPCRDVDSSELPIQTFQLGYPKVPLEDIDSVTEYFKWLDQEFASSSPTRLYEFAFVRLCEKRRPDDDNKLAFEEFEKTYREKLVECLRDKIKRNSQKVDQLDVESAVNTALDEFSRSLLASNEELPPGTREKRNRFAAISSVHSFLLLIAGRRLPRLAYVLTDKALQDFLNANEKVRELGYELDPIRGKAWRSKKTCLNALVREVGRDFHDQFGEMLIQSMERWTFTEVDKKVAIANDETGEFEAAEKPAEIDWYRRKPLPDPPKPPPSLCECLIEDKLPASGIEIFECLRDIFGFSLVPGRNLQEQLSEVRHQLQNTILNENHWDDCKFKKWRQNPLSDTEIARFTEFLFNSKSNESTKHQSFQRAFRKLHCCFATVLGDEFRRQATASFINACKSEQLPKRTILKAALGFERTRQICADSATARLYFLGYWSPGDIAKKTEVIRELGLPASEDDARSKRGQKSDQVMEKLQTFWREKRGKVIGMLGDDHG